MSFYIYHSKAKRCYVVCVKHIATGRLEPFATSATHKGAIQCLRDMAKLN